MLILPILLFSVPTEPVATSPIDTAPVAVEPVTVQNVTPVKSKWSGAISLGASIADGDTDTRNGNATADAEYRREHSRFTFGLTWNYQEDKNATPSITQRRTYFKAKYDYFFSKRTFGLVHGSAENDMATQLDLRTTLGVGIGHQFLEDEDWIGPGKWKVLVEAGIAQLDENFDVGSDDNYTTARGAYGAEWKPGAKLGLSQAFEILPSLEDSSDVSVRLDTRGKFSFTEKMFGQLQWLWIYDNTPNAGAARTNDTYALTIGWSF